MLGVVTGWVLHNYVTRKTIVITNRFIIAYVITFVYLGSVITNMVHPQHQIPYPFHAIMGVVVGWLFYNKKAADKLKGVITNR